MMTLKNRIMENIHTTISTDWENLPFDILLNTGIPDWEIELPASRLKQKAETDNHPFPILYVKNIPAALQKPIAIFLMVTVKRR